MRHFTLGNRFYTLISFIFLSVFNIKRDKYMRDSIYLKEISKRNKEWIYFWELGKINS